MILEQTERMAYHTFLSSFHLLHSDSSIYSSIIPSQFVSLFLYHCQSVAQFGTGGKEKKPWLRYGDVLGSGTVLIHAGTKISAPKQQATLSASEACSHEW